ncbi:MAG TPA: ankyrin repeat domain-containing protein [Pyrinomonadaceae bacterium]|jgi:hypothetical protein|nr:ankyrin repeat domain-containing protein [Pyrinomonadaceae bacterium]
MNTSEQCSVCAGKLNARSRFTRFSRIFVMLFALFLPIAAQAQTATNYRFLEVVDSDGKPVANARVETDHSDQKTDENGVVKQVPFSMGDFNTSKLTVSKPGYFSYEVNEAFFSGRYGCLLEGENTQYYDRSASIRVELLKIPVSAAEREAVDEEQRKRDLLMAARRGDGATVRRLLEAGVNSRTTDGQGLPAILWAVAGGNAESIEGLLAAGADPGPRALQYYLCSASALSEEVVRALLKAVPDVNSTDDRGRTALMWAALSWASHSEEAIKMLLEAAADIDAKDSEGRTALRLTVGYEFRGGQDLAVAKVKVLLDAGANVNIKDNWGNTALVVAKTAEHKALVKLLKPLTIP